MSFSSNDRAPLFASPLRQELPELSEVNIGGVLGLIFAAIYMTTKVRGELKKRALARSAGGRPLATDGTARHTFCVQLKNAGFFAGLSVEVANALELGLDRSGFSTVHDHPWRAIKFNGESLLDSGAAAMLKKFHPAFQALRVPVPSCESRLRDNGSLVLEMIGESGGTVTLFASEDLRRVPRQERDEWRASVVEVRLLRAVNRYLAAQGKPDQCFMAWGGPDYRERRVLMLTPAMLEIIRAYADVPLFGKPFLADDVWDPLPSGAGSAAQSRFCARLKAAGFFAKLTPTRAKELETRIAHGGFAEMFRHPWRNIHADDEVIAEGGAAEFIASAAPIFKRLEVPPLVGALRQSDDGTQILDLPAGAGGSLTLISATESAADNPDGHSLWGLIPARLFIAINRYLAARGSAERFYSVYGGNDAAVMVLTDAMFKAILELGDSKAKDRPYLRTEVPPSYGMPDT